MIWSYYISRYVVWYSNDVFVDGSEEEEEEEEKTKERAGKI